MLVVGAGPAGLMAAWVAAQRGLRVVLLEKNSRVGLKILISGGGRCNLTTTRAGDDLERQYGTRRGRFLRGALRAYPPTALCADVTALGVALQEEDLEKIFPVSGRAADVRDALLDAALAAGVSLRTSSPVLAIERRADGFGVHTPHGENHAPSLILATGGLSYPKTGATGDGYPMLASLGHSIRPTVPALAPLCLEQAWLCALQGLVLDARLTVYDRQQRELVTRRRPTLITHRGLSGPGPMDVSGFVEEVGGGCELRLDLAPDRDRSELEAGMLEAARTHPRRLVQHGLCPAIPERLRVALCERHGLGATNLAELDRERRRSLVDDQKGLRLPVDRSLGFAHAEVTRGGVALEEIDPKTMQSRVQTGLYVCGEILDVDGPIGGFNFQAAFATGRLAGLSCARDRSS